MTQYNRCPVIIRGVYYPSQKDAAKALGLNSSSISTALDRGSIDSCGFGLPDKFKIKITHNGITYPSIMQAAKEIAEINYISFANSRIKAEKKGRNKFTYKGKEYEWERYEG